MAVCWYNTNEPLFSCKNSGSPKRQPFIIDCRIQKMEVFPMSIIIGIDHGYSAIKTEHCSFPAGLTSYGEHEPYHLAVDLGWGQWLLFCRNSRTFNVRDTVQTKDLQQQDTLVSSTATSPCTHAVEPPCTGQYARWCERSVLYLGESPTGWKSYRDSIQIKMDTL